MKKIAFFCIFVPFLFFHLSADILHYSETTAHDHQTRAVSLAFFQNIGHNLGHEVVDDRDGSMFDSYESLSRFDVVIFSNTSGSNGLTEQQRENFENYIQDGGSFLGIHAASDTYRHSTSNGSNKGGWDWYAEMLTGCSVQHGPAHTSQTHIAGISLDKPGFSLSLGIPDPWIKKEEYYYWENGFLSSDFTEFMTVERTGNYSYDAPRIVAHYRQLPGGGKSFYTSLGHGQHNFTSDPIFHKLMKNAINWIIS